MTRAAGAYRAIVTSLPPRAKKRQRRLAPPLSIKEHNRRLFAGSARVSFNSTREPRDRSTSCVAARFPRSWRAQSTCKRVATGPSRSTSRLGGEAREEGERVAIFEFLKERFERLVL